MRFRDRSRLDPSQVEDLRGRGAPLGGRPMALGGVSLAGIVLVALYVLFGGSIGTGARSPLDGLAGTSLGPGSPSSDVVAECRTGQDANEREDCRAVAVVNSVHAYWARALRGYEPARTRFFDGVVRTGCGLASPAVGPFYCPLDRSVWIELGFFDQLRSQLGARGGPLAEAYVIAHEHGHHVQSLTGALGRAGRDTGPQGDQVRLELQADCYAGLWVGHALDTGLVEEITEQDVADALDAAAAVGDDRIQAAGQGRVTPESWTHGSSRQRQTWFRRGLRSPGPAGCDTFGAGA